jgi:hypothetical protein
VIFLGLKVVFPILVLTALVLAFNYCGNVKIVANRKDKFAFRVLESDIHDATDPSNLQFSDWDRTWNCSDWIQTCVPTLKIAGCFGSMKYYPIYTAAFGNFALRHDKRHT